MPNLSHPENAGAGRAVREPPLQNFSREACGYQKFQGRLVRGPFLMARISSGEYKIRPYSFGRASASPANFETAQLLLTAYRSGAWL